MQKVTRSEFLRAEHWKDNVTLVLADQIELELTHLDKIYGSGTALLQKVKPSFVHVSIH